MNQGNEKTQKEKFEEEQKSDSEDSSKKIMHSPSRKLIAIAILCCLIIPVIPVCIFIPQIQNSYQFPLIAKDNQGLQAFGVPSDFRIADYFPLTAINPTPVAIYNLTMAGNEYQSFQLVLSLGGESINEMTYWISDFTSTGVTAATIGAGNITVQYVQDVLENSFPDELVNFNTLNLIEQKNQILYITAFVPYESPAGRYTGSITFFYSRDENFSVNLGLNVWNFSIPLERHFRSNFGGDNDNPQIQATYNSHLLNTYGVPMPEAFSLDQLQTEPGYVEYLNATTDTWIFNWTWWDSMTTANFAAGANAFEIPNPMGMPRDLCIGCIQMGH